MNGKYLDGELLLEICKSYEQAINNGSIPNIESAWNCLCKSETLKAFNEAEELLDQQQRKFSNNKCLTKEEMKLLKTEVIIPLFISLIFPAAVKNIEIVQEKSIW
jgi:hypothetical protein